MPLVASRHQDAQWRSELRNPTIVTALAGLLFLLTPRLTGWTFNYVHKEDGTIFLVDSLHRGWAGLFDLYSGYLHVFPRLIAGLCAVGPAATYPGCITVAVAGVKLWFFVVAVAVFAGWVSGRWTPVVCAAGFLFVAVGQHEPLGNITNLRWYGDAFVVIALAGNFRRPGWAIPAGITTMLAVLTDPIALGFVPVAFYRLLTGRRWARVTPALYLAGAGVQAAMLHVGERTVSGDGSLFAHPGEVFPQLLVRGATMSLLGCTVPQAVMNVGGFLLAAMIGCAVISWVGVLIGRREVGFTQQRPLLAYLAGSAIAVLLATLAFADLVGIRLDAWWSPANAPRYSVAPAILLWPALTIAAVAAPTRRWQRVGAAVALALSLGVVGDLRGDPYTSHGPAWLQTVAEARATCASSKVPETVVHFTPQGVPTRWDGILPCSWLTR